MAWTLETLIFSLVASFSCSLASVSHDPRGYTYHEHTLTRPYDDGHDLAHWDFFGSTVVSDKYVRLTPDRQSRKGSLWNKIAFEPPPSANAQELSATPSWEAIVEFRVHGTGKKLFGDGFAFWYTKARANEGPVFGNQDNFVGLGIFFDTYSNLQQGHQQYISVMISDGTQSYDHSKDGGDYKLAGCAIDFRGKDFSVFARVVYQEGLLRMYIDASDNEWQECFVIRSVRLPRGYYFGLTAATGDLADNHDVLSFKVAEPAPLSPEEKVALQKRIEDDIRDNVAAAPHHDPQYDPALQAQHSDLPAYLLVVGVLVVIGIAVAIVVMATKVQKRANTHFT